MHPRRFGFACLLFALLCPGCATAPSAANSSAADAAVDVAATDTPPVLRESAVAVFPSSLRNAGMGGSAVLDFIVDTNGNVIRPSVVKASQPLIGAVAKVVVLHRRYVPARKAGKPVACRMEMTITFRLDDESVDTHPETLAATEPDAGVMDDAIDASQADVKPAAQKRVGPKYPVALRDAGVTGSAVIEFIVNTQGVVTRATVVRATNAQFGEAAKAAVQQWRFRPGEKEGRPVACRMQVPIMFTIGRGRPS